MSTAASSDEEQQDTYPSGEATLFPRVFTDDILHLNSNTEDSGYSTESGQDSGGEYILGDYQSPPREETTTTAITTTTATTERPITDERTVPLPSFDESKESRIETEDHQRNQPQSTVPTRGRQSTQKKNNTKGKKKKVARSLSKGTKNGIKRKKGKKMKKKKSKKKKTKKKKSKKINKQSKPFHTLAYTAADLWRLSEQRQKDKEDPTTTITEQQETKTSTQPSTQPSMDLSSTTSTTSTTFHPLQIQYQPGPIGVTFAWNNALIVMAVPGVQTSLHLKITYPPIGARLSSVNGTSILQHTFKQTVELLEQNQITERTLGFDVLDIMLLKKKENDLKVKLKKEKNAKTKKKSTKKNNTNNVGADILKLPKIARPSSSTTQLRPSTSTEDRPSSAGNNIENPEEHDLLLTKEGWKEKTDDKKNNNNNNNR